MQVGGSGDTGALFLGLEKNAPCANLLAPLQVILYGQTAHASRRKERPIRAWTEDLLKTCVRPTPILTLESQFSRR